MRARMNCRTRNAGGTSRSRLFTCTVWVASSTRGATNVITLVATTLPSLSRSCTGRPTRACVDRLRGTWMYTSSPCFSSIVVITVWFVTRSPSRTGMSPTTPDCGAVTR
jgi:hypothetical protein